MKDKNLISIDRSKFLKEQRRSKNLSIYDIALRLSLSKLQVIRYEKGLEPIPDKIFQKLKTILEF